jgi:hypothetical protein
VSVSTTDDHVILDLTSEEEPGEWEEGGDHSLSAIAGVRSELAAGDLRPLYLAWLSSFSGWWKDGGDDADWEDIEEPPVPAGLEALTTAQHALADFLRVDLDLLVAAAEASPELPEVKGDAPLLAAYLAKLPTSEKDRLLMLVGEDQAARAPDGTVARLPRRTGRAAGSPPDRRGALGRRRGVCHGRRVGAPARPCRRGWPRSRVSVALRGRPLRERPLRASRTQVGDDR